MRNFIGLLSLTALVGLVGCGGGGGTTPPATTAVNFSITWPERSRAITGLSSALSARFVLAGAKSDGTDLSFIVNRDTSNLAEHTVAYTTPDQARVGTWNMTVTFFSQATGGGNEVGTAAAQATIAADGSGVPNVAATGKITSVSVVADQMIDVGQQISPLVSCRDSGNNVVAVSEGSIFYSEAGGFDNVDIVQGQVRGTNAGMTMINARVDGMTSANAPLHVFRPLPNAYSLTDLGAFETVSAAHDLNSSGIVVGESNVGPFPKAFRHDGTMTDLGTLGGDFSRAFGINDNGVITGTAADVGIEAKAFRYQNNTMTNLGTLGGTNSSGFDINASGQIVGDAERASGFRFAAMWINGAVTDLDALPGDTKSEARAINDGGQVVGSSTNPANVQRAYLWTPSTPNGTTGTMTSLGALGGIASSARGINNVGQVVGQAQNADGQFRAFLWSSGTMQSLGALGTGTFSVANSLNSKGEIVGSSTTVGPDQLRAFVGNRKIGIVNLSNLVINLGGWTLQQATAINENGQIVGVGSVGGVTKAYLLTPVP